MLFTTIKGKAVQNIQISFCFYKYLPSAHLRINSLAYYFATRKSKRIKELKQTKIVFEQEQAEKKDDQVSQQSLNFISLRQKIKDLDDWQNMSFDKLCNLDPITLHMLQLQVKKDKFNVPDQQFYLNTTTNPTAKLDKSMYYPKLNNYYKKAYSLLISDHAYYDQISEKVHKDIKTGYLNEMYVMDLKNDPELEATIQLFLENLMIPKQLQTLAEPSLAKYILSLKRQLIMQGVYFETETQKKKIKKKEIVQNLKSNMKEQTLQDLISKEEQEEQIQKDEKQAEFFMDNPNSTKNQEKNNGQKQNLLNDQANLQNESKDTQNFNKVKKNGKERIKVKVVKILNNEYEFWVDVKHNRNKNGNIDNYVIEDREIQNPNKSILFKETSPTINVKYIMRKKKHKDYEMNFCLKSELLILINDTHYRTIKVQWKGPSNKTEKQKQSPNTQAPISYIVIDYENLMNGNPTIKSIFTF